VASKGAVKAEADSAASQPASRFPFLTSPYYSLPLPLPLPPCPTEQKAHPLAAEPCLARYTAERQAGLAGGQGAGRCKRRLL
jgi:hypothetical protein